MNPIDISSGVPFWYTKENVRSGKGEAYTGPIKAVGLPTLKQPYHLLVNTKGQEEHKARQRTGLPMANPTVEDVRMDDYRVGPSFLGILYSRECLSETADHSAWIVGLGTW